MAAPKKSAAKGAAKSGGKGESGAAKKGSAGKSAAKSGGEGGAAKKGATKSQRGTQGGLAREVTPDKDLAAIIGPGSLTRAALTQKIWDYIRSNNLQDQQDKRMINADAKLRTIFGKDQVSMFEMTKLVNQHVS